MKYTNQQLMAFLDSWENMIMEQKLDQLKYILNVTKEKKVNNLLIFIIIITAINSIFLITLLFKIIFGVS